MPRPYPGPEPIEPPVSRTGCLVVFGLFGLVPVLLMAGLVLIRWVLYGVWPWK